MSLNNRNIKESFARIVQINSHNIRSKHKFIVGWGYFNWCGYGIKL